MSKETEADNAAKAMERIILSVLVGTAIAFTLIMSLSNGGSMRGVSERRVQGGLGLDESRRLAIEWATPECRSDVEAAVRSAIDSEQVVAAAWKACPNHPEAEE